MNTDIKNCGLRDTVIRVDLSAIAENMEHICQLVGKETTTIRLINQTYFNVKNIKVRSEERRVGKECRSRWSPYH